jgi:hypothetical protein
MQGDRYFNYLGTALGYSRLNVFQTWGVYDGSSWIPSFVPGRGQALPLDFNFDRKPAYWGMWNALAGQCEKLTVLGLSSGDSQAVISNTALSANAGRQLTANASGDFITLQADVPFSGQWNLKIGALKQATAGIFQLAIAPPGSATFTNVSTEQDTYAASAAASQLDLGTATFSSTGNWQFRFTVTGKNSSASSDNLLLDYIRLTPVSCPPTVSPLAAQSIAINSSMPARLFLAEDDIAEGSLQVTATSSNPTLLPATAILLNGASPYYTIAASPTADQLGSSTIGVTASDGSTTFSRNFTLTVTGTPLQSWRQQYFGSAANTGSAADNADANYDGESNFMEFATAQSPTAAALTTAALIKNGATLEFTYPRSVAALADAVTFIVEWSDDLSLGSWSSSGVTQAILSDNGTVQSVRASVAIGPSSKRFLRLHVFK